VKNLLLNVGGNMLDELVAQYEIVLEAVYVHLQNDCRALLGDFSCGW
jgi:hypothetical protein